MDQESSMKNLAIFVVVLALSGCSFKQEIPTKHYTIEYSNKIPLYTQSNKSIAIAKPTLNAPYASKDIFFTRKPYVFEQYAVNKWVELPNLMIQNILYESFVDSHFYTNVALDNSKANSDLNLQSNIIKLFHAYENNQSYAIVHIKFDVIEKNKSIFSLPIEKKILCEENSPYGFINQQSIR
jgi:cholesterol transport system auxiliary component